MATVMGLVMVGFGLGVLAVVAAEALGLLWIMKRLRQKISDDQAHFSSKTLAPTPPLDPQQSLDFAYRKQGVVWVLESGKISKPSREQNRKMEILEVSPVKMYGQIKGQSLILREADGLHTEIELKGCAVQAVSASILSSRKWLLTLNAYLLSRLFHDLPRSGGECLVFLVAPWQMLLLASYSF